MAKIIVTREETLFNLSHLDKIGADDLALTKAYFEQLRDDCADAFDDGALPNEFPLHVLDVALILVDQAILASADA